ncbi:hypothetical protein RJ640_015809 [Escallonia rubra]|uniref:Retrotransposon gag domain-containing protein n=1 Tax=Escallonia rubra TaxID=112253 RepID=A0AA88USH5_9ASTE|nr:hypothetical protein RJ640_015809 [Escallonia rubra]
MADEGTQRRNNPEFNAEGQDGHNPQASAERWWKLLSMKWKRKRVPSTWENFKREFTNKYVPRVTQERREVNFIKFEQRNMSVSVYESQFTDLARFCPHLVDTEERKARKFVKGLNKDLRDKLIPLQLQTYMAVVDTALAIENDLEEQKNVDTEPFRASSYGGQGNRNSGNVNPGGMGQGNTWQEIFKGLYKEEIIISMETARREEVENSGRPALSNVRYLVIQ